MGLVWYMMWCQWQFVRTRMMVSKWLKGGVEGQKIPKYQKLCLGQKTCH